MPAYTHGNDAVGDVSLRSLEENLTAGGNDIDNSDSDSDGKENREADGYHSWPFPLNICPCLPGCVSVMLPRTWQVIQDWTHLAVIAGLFGAITLLFQAVSDIIDYDERCSPMCSSEALSLAAVAPTFAYICKIVATYDEQLQVKKKQVADQKRELTNSYEAMIDSIDDLLGKASESSSLMAERGFESKRRDFIRFLDRAVSSFGQVTTSSEAEREMMLVQFRRFVLQWLAIFQECSIDPVNHPKLVVSSEELSKCKSIQEVATLTLKRLKETEVKFISSQRDKDTQLLRGLRVQHRRMTQTGGPALPALMPPNQPNEIELTSVSPMRADTEAQLSNSVDDAREISPTSHGPPSFSSGRQGRADESATRNTGCCSCCAWLQCSSSGEYGCGLLPKASAGPYPKVWQCWYMQLMLLSDDHSSLILGFILGLVTLVVQGLPIKPDGPASEAELVLVLVPIWAYIGCIAMLLIRFEELDVIHKIQGEITELQIENDRVVKRREQMVEFWNSMQSLTDLWVHRTVPRLDLFKEIQGHLEYGSPNDVLGSMTTANSQIQELESRLPEVALWIEGGGLSEASQKAFAEHVLELCRKEDLPTLLNGLGQLVETGLAELKDAESGAAPDLDVDFGRADARPKALKPLM